jgi:hypothetical protein
MPAQRISSKTGGIFAITPQKELSTVLKGVQHHLRGVYGVNVRTRVTRAIQTMDMRVLGDYMRSNDSPQTSDVYVTLPFLFSGEVHKIAAETSIPAYTVETLRYPVLSAETSFRMLGQLDERKAWAQQQTGLEEVETRNLSFKMRDLLKSLEAPEASEASCYVKRLNSAEVIPPEAQPTSSDVIRVRQQVSVCQDLQKIVRLAGQGMPYKNELTALRDAGRGLVDIDQLKMEPSAVELMATLHRLQTQRQYMF